MPSSRAILANSDVNGQHSSRQPSSRQSSSRQPSSRQSSSRQPFSRQPSSRQPLSTVNEYESSTARASHRSRSDRVLISEMTPEDRATTEAYNDELRAEDRARMSAIDEEFGCSSRSHDDLIRSVLERDSECDAERYDDPMMRGAPASFRRFVREASKLDRDCPYC